MHNSSICSEKRGLSVLELRTSSVKGCKMLAMLLQDSAIFWSISSIVIVDLLHTIVRTNLEPTRGKICSITDTLPVVTELRCTILEAFEVSYILLPKTYPTKCVFFQHDGGILGVGSGDRPYTHSINTGMAKNLLQPEFVFIVRGW